jgi:hypothetical protein
VAIKIFFYDLTSHVQKWLFGGFLALDLRHLELIFLDETWHTSSLGQNLDPIFFFGRQHLWSHL